MSAHPDVRDAKHWLGFLISGAIAFAVDGATMKLLTHFFGMPILASRLIGITLAMVAGWLAHRRLTFCLATPPSVTEFVKYAGVAWIAAAVNYVCFAAILFVMPTLEPLIALLASSAVAMGAAYLGMRFAAFRRPKG